MLISSIENTINTWSNWAAIPTNRRFDIALLKIWIQFERFIAELFINYATGNCSEIGYYPSLNLRFNSEEQLNIFLREGNRTYIEYPNQIKKLSPHIFQNNPFDVIFLDSTNYTAYNQIISIRNYIAHESGEARTKMINLCFSGNSANFKEPNDYLQTVEPSTRNTYYTYYTDIIKNIASLLINPPQ